jgi:DNA-binding transcriptional LysR family regulator
LAVESSFPLDSGGPCVALSIRDTANPISSLPERLNRRPTASTHPQDERDDGQPSIVDARWKTFLKVAELGSLTKAALALAAPPAVVSRHVSQLERQCGTRLFQRTGRGVVLTEFGHSLLPQIATLLAQAERLADEIRTQGDVPMGEVSVGLLPSTVPLLTGPMVSAVHERMPRVRLRLVEGASAQLDEHLREGRLDMAVVLREDAEPTPDEPVVARLALHLVGRQGDAHLQHGTIAFETLLGLPLIVPSRPHLLRARLERLAGERNVQLNVTLEADSVRLQHQAAAAGAGYAISGDPWGAQSDPRLQSVKIVSPELLRSVVIGTTLRRPHTLATRQVHRLLCELAAAHLLV